MSRAALGIIAGLVAAACGGDEPPRPSGEELVLAVASAWTPVEAADDPFDDRPAEFECDDDGAVVEELSGEDVFALYTERCAYVTATQPSAEPIRAGDRVRVRLWNFQLFPRVDGEAHPALAIDGEVVWEDRLALTGGQAVKSGLRRDDWIADREVPAGTPLHWHLHNHGANEWALFDVLVVTQ